MQLQDAIEQTHEVSNAFSEQVKREDDFFFKSKAIEIREALDSFTNAKVQFYQHVRVYICIQYLHWTDW